MKLLDPFFSTRDGALGAGLGLPVASVTWPAEQVAT